MFPLLVAPVVQIAEHIVLGVILDRLAKFRTNTDWTQLKLDADRKVRAIVPGVALDDAAVMAVNQLIDKVQAALGEKAEIEKVCAMLAEGDAKGAAAELLKHAFPAPALAVVAA